VCYSGLVEPREDGRLFGGIGSDFRRLNTNVSLVSTTGNFISHHGCNVFVRLFDSAGAGVEVSRRQIGRCIGET
jgi:hypothetical protein